MRIFYMCVRLPISDARVSCIRRRSLTSVRAKREQAHGVGELVGIAWGITLFIFASLTLMVCVRVLVCICRREGGRETALVRVRECVRVSLTLLRTITRVSPLPPPLKPTQLFIHYKNTASEDAFSPPPQDEGAAVMCFRAQAISGRRSNFHFLLVHTLH